MVSGPSSGNGFKTTRPIMVVPENSLLSDSSRLVLCLDILSTAINSDGREITPVRNGRAFVETPGHVQPLGQV
jgi:hypothetical protein